MMSTNNNIFPFSGEDLPPDCVVFKHSSRCPVSAAAAVEVRKHRWDVPLFWVNVIEQRTMSDRVAAQFGIRHESPQLLFVRGGQVIKILNQGEIRVERFDPPG